MSSRQPPRNKSVGTPNKSPSKLKILRRSTSKRSPSRSPGMAATVRRMSDQDVRDIFECLHQHAPPPPHLKFKIVPVGPTGLKLSPPSFEFVGMNDHVYQLFMLLACLLACLFLFVPVNLSCVFTFWAASHTLSFVRNTQTVSTFCCVRKKRKRIKLILLFGSHRT
jgi:hypothetical protein